MVTVQYINMKYLKLFNDAMVRNQSSPLEVVQLSLKSLRYNCLQPLTKLHNCDLVREEFERSKMHVRGSSIFILLIQTTELFLNGSEIRRIERN